MEMSSRIGLGLEVAGIGIVECGHVYRIASHRIALLTFLEEVAFL